MLTQTTGTSIKKIITKITALVLAALLCLSMPFYAKAAQVTTSIYTSSKYTHNARFDGDVIENGIDISQHNGDINWAELKKTKTKYIIVRVGCRGYAAKGTLLKDKVFDENITNSLKNGFETGVYFYSQAVTEAEAKEEANFVLQYIKDYKFQLPVYYDYEFATYSGRLDTAWRNGTLNKEKMTNNALAFCNTIEDAGYKAGIYASKSFYEDNLIPDKLDSYAIWVAHYNSKTTYSGEYQAWQYSAKGKVDGIDGYVDSNFIYYKELTPLLSLKRFEIEDIKKQSYTGKEVKPSLKVLYNGKELIKGEDYYVSFENNINIGKAKVTVTGINDYEKFDKITKEFSIVPPKVTGLKLESRSANSLTVSWDKSEFANKYYVQVHRSSGWVKAGTTKNTSFEITDLASASNYRIRVRAYKTIDSNYYYGYYCDEIETATSPAKPTELSATNITPTSLKLNWKKQSNASYYEVYLYNTETKKSEFYSEVTGGKNNYLVVEGLLPNKRYSFKVRAYKNSKDGALLKSSKSDSFAAYTSLPAPEISSASSKAVKKITVNWKKVANASGYQIMWSTTKDFSSNYKTVNATGTSTTLTTAQSGKTYYVKVRTYKTRNDKKVYSPWSKTLSTKTK